MIHSIHWFRKMIDNFFAINSYSPDQVIQRRRLKMYCSRRQ